MPGRLARVARRFDAPQPNLPTVQIGQYHYPQDRVVNLYQRLSRPQLEGEVFTSPRVRAEVDAGEVGFKTYYPETVGQTHAPDGWGYLSPQEMGVAQVTPPPSQDMRGMIRSLRSQLFIQSPDGTMSPRPSGAGMYFNAPVGGSDSSRGNLYSRYGFVPVDDELQVLDNRRFRRFPAIAQVYAAGDMEFLEPEVSAVTVGQLREMHGVRRYVNPFQVNRLLGSPPALLNPGQYQ